MAAAESVIVVTNSLELRLQIRSLVTRALGLQVLSIHHADLLTTKSFWLQHRTPLLLIEEAVAAPDDYSMLRSICALQPGQLIVLVGRNERDEAAVRGLDAGAADVLPLPLRFGEAAARLKAVLRSRRRRLQQGLPASGLIGGSMAAHPTLAYDATKLRRHEETVFGGRAHGRVVQS